MKQEFEIEDEWVSFEIHPETPAEGVPVETMFPKASWEQMNARLSDSAEQVGLRFVGNPIISNSRLALEASEFARDEGKFDEFHSRLFEAYFGRSLNIGDKQVLGDLAKSSGLDVDELYRALDDGRYTERTQEGLQEGQQYGVTGTPTFIINDKYKIVGAQPLEVMRQALQEIGQRESAG